MYFIINKIIWAYYIFKSKGNKGWTNEKTNQDNNGPSLLLSFFLFCFSSLYLSALLSFSPNQTPKKWKKRNLPPVYSQDGPSQTPKALGSPSLRLNKRFKSFLLFLYSLLFLFLLSNPLSSFHMAIYSHKMGSRAWLVNCCWRGDIPAGACVETQLVMISRSVGWQRDGGAVTAWLSCKHMGAASGKVIKVAMYRELVWGAGIGSRGGNVMELHG